MQKYKLGRIRPKARGPRLSLKNYMLASLPLPPDHVNYTPDATACLSQMYLNNELGCCTSAEAFHHAGVLLSNAGTAAPAFTNAEVEAFYSATSGYVPGDPSTDNGADETTVLSYWQDKGLFSGQHKIVSWLAVDPTSPREIKTAIWLFGGVSFCAELPDEWVNNEPSASGFVWKPAGAPDPNNGHCFGAFGYNSVTSPFGYKAAYGPIISTWGMLGLITWRAVEQYCVPSAGGDTYAVLSADWIEKVSGKAPVGLDLTQLQADLQAIGHA